MRSAYQRRGRWSSRSMRPNRQPQSRASRRGIALVVTLLFIVAAGALATSAILLAGNANLVAKSYAKENTLKYAAEAALETGKSRLNFDPAALPDTGYKTMVTNGSVYAADNKPVPGVHVNVYIGPSGSTSGQFGRFASVVAEARDAQNNGFVRRLELAQESFAKFAYWSDKEQNGGSTIYFNNGDQLWGPVWSNDVIHIASGGATFHDEVGTAQTISGIGNGTFMKGYAQNQKPIALPSTALLSKLSGYAGLAGFSFVAPSNGDETTVQERIEFVATDMDSPKDGDSTGVNEGFFRVYKVANAANIPWLRGDVNFSGAKSTITTCGDFHRSALGGVKFYPVSVHTTANVWFTADLTTAAGVVPPLGLTAAQATAEANASTATIMQHPGARCYLGGDPHLVAVARTAALYPLATSRQKGGEDTTFTPTDWKGAWVQFTPTPNALVLQRRNGAAPTDDNVGDANYLFPIYRGLNAGSKGVIYVAGTTGVSGVLNGQITLYATGTTVVLDNLRYSADPSIGVCKDILGMITGNDLVIADNALNTPQDVSGGGGPTLNLKATKDLYIHAVVMALNTSWRVENYSSGPNNANGCGTTVNGRGCLYLTGGIIQEARGAVGLSSGEGFSKRYSYDRCAVVNPPPYFPTTGRFTDNRYYELDPVNFSVSALFRLITPAP